MWVGTAYCGPVALNVGPVADNVGRTTGLVAINVVPKRGVIVGPSESYCGPLQIADTMQGWNGNMIYCFTSFKIVYDDLAI